MATTPVIAQTLGRTEMEMHRAIIRERRLRPQSYLMPLRLACVILSACAFFPSAAQGADLIRPSWDFANITSKLGAVTQALNTSSLMTIFAPNLTLSGLQVNAV